MALRERRVYARCSSVAWGTTSRYQLIDEDEDNIMLVPDVNNQRNLPANTDIRVQGVDESVGEETPHDPRAPICFCLECQQLIDFQTTFIVTGMKPGARNYHYLCGVCLQRAEDGKSHHPCNLACDHFFGVRCILRWLGLSVAGNQCPICKKQARISNIRLIFGNTQKDELIDALWDENEMLKSKELALQNALQAALELNNHLHESMELMWLLNATALPSW